MDFVSYVKLVLKILLTFLLQRHVSSHGSGAPESRCESMVPGHWVSPQESISPFQVLVDKTVITPGDRVNITLSKIRGQPGFKGFFVMVKEALDDDPDVEENKKKNYGVFDLSTSDLKHSQPVHCFSSRNSAMTHVINDVKDKVELFWIAPKLSEEERNGKTEKTLKVIATFVKDFWTVWVDVEPAGGARLLLSDTQQFSPKFDLKQLGNHNLDGNAFRNDPQISSQNQEPPSSGGNPSVGVIQLDGDSSWAHFSRAWNYVLGLFNSTPTQPQK